MTRDLERERIRDPDRLEAERHRPGGLSRVPGRRPAYTPISEEQAAHNLAVLEAALADPAPPMEGTE